MPKKSKNQHIDTPIETLENLSVDDILLKALNNTDSGAALIAAAKMLQARENEQSSRRGGAIGRLSRPALVDELLELNEALGRKALI